tara:strand:+ start:1103 stop:1642 length:540 start_codon:yes stop_codon:yes gene_type:complete
MKTDKWLTIGKIVAPQGLQGKLRVNPCSEFPERFIEPGNRWIQITDEDPKKIYLVSGSQIPGKSLFVVKIDGVKNRSEAELLVGYKLLVPAESRPKMKKNEIHFLDLIGMKAFLAKNNSLIGTVKDLRKAGNDLLEIETVDKKIILVPFVQEIVPDLNVEEKWLIIDPPPGLFDLVHLD